jgi:hypothetical protein
MFTVDDDQARAWFQVNQVQGFLPGNRDKTALSFGFLKSGMAAVLDLFPGVGRNRGCARSIQQSSSAACRRCKKEGEAISAFNAERIKLCLLERKCFY